MLRELTETCTESNWWAEYRISVGMGSRRARKAVAVGIWGRLFKGDVRRGATEWWVPKDGACRMFGAGKSVSSDEDYVSWKVPAVSPAFPEASGKEGGESGGGGIKSRVTSIGSWEPKVLFWAGEGGESVTSTMELWVAGISGSIRTVELYCQLINLSRIIFGTTSG